MFIKTEICGIIGDGAHGSPWAFIRINFRKIMGLDRKMITLQVK